jgi:TolB protein
MRRRVLSAAVGLAAVAAMVSAPASSRATTSSTDRPACAGGQLIFTRWLGSGPMVATMAANGSGLHVLGPGHAAKWSPNGRSIAFDNGSHVLVANASRKHVTDLTPGLKNTSSNDPAWSPNGRWIVFASEPTGTRNAALWLVRRDGTGLHKLVDAPGEEENASWSPNGAEIVFDSFPASGSDHLYVVHSDGSRLHEIGPDSVDAWGPEWSSHGLIAFADNHRGSTSDVFTIRPNGSGLRQLTHAHRGVALAFPSFSPNGADIVLSRIKGARGSLYRMTASGRDLAKLSASGDYSDEFADWGPCRR